MPKYLKLEFKAPANRGLAIFSIPQTNHYQRITDLQIKPNNWLKISEKNWGNGVAVFRFNDVNASPLISFNSEPKKFSNVINKNFKISQYSNLLKPDRFINGKDSKIITLAKKAIDKEKYLEKIIYQLYHFTLDHLKYGKPTEGLYSYKQAMEEKTTDCGGFSTFLASLLQSINIPSRLVVGFLIRENWYTRLFSSFEFCTLSFEFLMMHAWLEVLLPNNSWFPLDPSIEWRRRKGLTKRTGGFGYIPGDRFVTSFGQDFAIDIDGKSYEFDLLQNPNYI